MVLCFWYSYVNNMEWKPTDVTILFVYCWISTCFGPTGPSSGEFVQLLTQPLVQFLCRSVRVQSTRTERHRNWTNGCVNSCTNSPEDGPVQSTRTERHRNWTNGCVNSCTNSPEDGPVGPKHVEIQQYTNKIVTSVGFHSICWKGTRYKTLKIYVNNFDIYFHFETPRLGISARLLLHSPSYVHVLRAPCSRNDTQLP